jgi:hypothetical protein
MRRCCALVCLLLGFGACASASAGGQAPTSGISGRVVAGPTCPVETVPPQPRCAPRSLTATLRIHAVGSHAPAIRVRSGADGRFRVRLSPATYVIRPMPVNGSPFPRPPAAFTVKVHTGRFTPVTITYDTGIR